MWKPLPAPLWREHLLRNGWDVHGEHNLQFSCPVRAKHPSGDQHPSFSFNAEKDVGHCFAGQCGAVIEGEVLWAMTGGGGIPAVPLVPISTVQRYDPVWPQALTEGHRRWLQHQGLTDGVVTAARIGSGSRGIGIPWVHRSGQLLWVNWRTLGNPKYLADKGAPKRTSLYGWALIPRHVAYVCLVEAELDALWCIQHEIPAVAMGGLALSTEQQQQLRGFGVPVVVLVDGDAAGVQQQPVLLQKLGELGRSGPLLPGNPRQHDADALRLWISGVLR